MALIILALTAFLNLNSSFGAAYGQPSPAAAKKQIYYPNAGEDWEKRAPEQVEMDPARPKEAVSFASVFR